MPTTVIPFGTPHTDPSRFPPVDNFFMPDHDPYDEPLVLSTTGYTSIDALSSTDTGSYASVDHSTYYHNAVPPHPDAALRIFILAQQDTPFSLPSGVDNATVVAKMISRKTGTAERVLNYTLEGALADSFTYTFSHTPTDAWITGAGLPTPLDFKALRNLAAGTAVMRVGLRATDGFAPDETYATDIAYLGIEITWTGGSTRKSFNRINQRGSDGYGITGGRRVLNWRSGQSSNRRGPAAIW